MLTNFLYRVSIPRQIFDHCFCKRRYDSLFIYQFSTTTILLKYSLYRCDSLTNFWPWITFSNDDSSLLINFQQQRFCSKLSCIEYRFAIYFFCSYVRQIYRVYRLSSVSDHKIVLWKIFVTLFYVRFARWSKISLHSKV